MPLSTRCPLVAGNWKMNGLRRSIAELDGIIDGSRDLPEHLDLLVCPPFTLLITFVERAAGTRVSLGAQDCHEAPCGAFTGDIAAEMLADAGATAVIVGHSERRSYHHETDVQVCAKARAAWRAGLTAIVCVGETQTERDRGSTLDVIARQLAGSIPEAGRPSNLLVAYEPVWAIGTGRTPTPEDVAEVHGMIRIDLVERLGSEAAAGVRVLYGGSVKPSNAQELSAIPDVDGALVGGASLKSAEFIAIAKAYG